MASPARTVYFRPYRADMGPSFRLRLWDDLPSNDPYGKLRIRYMLEIKRQGKPCYEPLFSGDDFYTPNASDSDATVEGIMGFLTLRPGDTDPDYFAGYTDGQRDYCDQYAETLSCEVHFRFGEEN